MKPLFSLFFVLTFFVSNLHAQETWDIDMMHSYVGFDVVYMEIIPFHGKFGELTGVVTAKEKDFSDMSIDVVIPVKSIETGSEKREKHLASTDFFDADNFPDITFVSTSISKVKVKKEEQFKITGNLTIRGVTKSIVLHGKFTSEPVQDPWGHIKVGCSFRGQINRQDYGISYGQVLDSGALAVNNEVDIILDIVLMKER